MSERLVNKVLLVSGAGPAVSSAIACRALDCGAEAVLVAHDPGSRDAAESALAGTGAQLVAHNRAEPGAWPKLYDRLESESRLPDVLVNGCYAHHAGTLAETSLEQFSQALQSNLTAAFFGTQTAVVRLRAAGRKGAIINMSSVFADRALAGTAAYAASAGGIRSLSKSAALACAEAGDGIHIHTVLTGHYEGGPDLPAGGDPLLDGRISVGEVAALVVQLAGDGATYTHGSAVTLDGGLWIS
ncbi:MAG: SDR family oxidoreductase [Gammaproteobacteria bacterium]|nr:SDR family oxidoreductase [Gammaproteobacteria bacterium]MXZ27606.1 SDR family oxidoreductase [Gammaproteobacteria bacterium]MYF59732.1 SDR family oxidoreductase [Gammaproteobacteria bacterium]